MKASFFIPLRRLFFFLRMSAYASSFADCSTCAHTHSCSSIVNKFYCILYVRIIYVYHIRTYIVLVVLIILMYVFKVLYTNLLFNLYFSIASATVLSYRNNQVSFRTGYVSTSSKDTLFAFVYVCRRLCTDSRFELTGNLLGASHFTSPCYPPLRCFPLTYMSSRFVVLTFLFL